MKNALWKKAEYNDGQKGREVRGKYIRVEIENATRSEYSPSSGVTVADWSKVYRSDSFIAGQIEGGDNVIIDGYKYTVDKTEQTKNRSGYNTFDTLIYVK